MVRERVCESKGEGETTGALLAGGCRIASDDPDRREPTCCGRGAEF